MKKNKDLIKRIVIRSIVVLIIITAIFGIKFFIKEQKLSNQYSQAITLMNKKQYDNAIKVFKSIENYKDSKQQLIKAYYLYAKDEISSSNYEHAIELLEKCKDYSDSNELLIDSNYNYAIKIIKSDEIKAIRILNKISDYKDSKKYIDNYNYKHRFDGTYFMSFQGKTVEEGSSTRIVINGLSKNTEFITYSYNLKDIHLRGSIYHKGRYNTHVGKLICNDTFSTCKQIVLTNVDKDGYYEQTFDENAKNIYSINTYVFKKDMVTKNTHYVKKLYNFDKDSATIYRKISDTVELPSERKETTKPKEPSVGMTKDEVEASTWGYPIKKNKSTYSWGTTEQWVYSNNRYVYFKNGIVTSVHE